MSKIITESISDWDSPSNRSHYSHIKDMDVTRPVMKPKPDGERYGTKSHGAQQWDLYLQDQASDVMIDKYGLEKGHKAWYGSIGAGKNQGAMFAASAAIANEKSAMCDDLGIMLQDYFERSYFDIWKEWVAKIHNKDITKLKPIVRKDPAPAAAPAPAPVKQMGKRFAQLMQTVQPSPKDTMRVEDIMNKAAGDRYKMNQLATQMANVTNDVNKLIGRGKAAEDENMHTVAKIFFDRAEQVLNEATRQKLTQTLVEAIEKATGKKIVFQEQAIEMGEYLKEDSYPEADDLRETHPQLEKAAQRIAKVVIDAVNKQFGEEPSTDETETNGTHPIALVLKRVINLLEKEV